MRSVLIEGTIEEKFRAIVTIQRMLQDDAIDGEKAKNVLVKAFFDPDLKVKYRAIEAAITDKRTISAVFIPLRVGDPATRRMTIRLLNKELGHDSGIWKTDNITDEEVNEACTLLIRALLDASEDVRMEACGSLCKIAERSPAIVMERTLAFRNETGELVSGDSVLEARIRRVENDAKEAMEHSRAKG